GRSAEHAPHTAAQVRTRQARATRARHASGPREVDDLRGCWQQALLNTWVAYQTPHNGQATIGILTGYALFDLPGCGVGEGQTRHIRSHHPLDLRMTCGEWFFVRKEQLLVKLLSWAEGREL